MLNIIPSRQNAQEAWEALLQLQIDREPFTLVQGLRSYDNIVILTLNEQQDKETSNGLFFNATMKEVIFVGAEATTLSQFNEPDIADQVLPTIIGGLKNLAGLVHSWKGQQRDSNPSTGTRLHLRQSSATTTWAGLTAPYLAL